MVRDNDTYAWTGHYNVNRAYGTNGLNQLTSAGATPLGYDLRGNLTSSGSDAYSYTSENRLATGSGGVTLYYDPTGRMSQLVQGTATTKFEYLGPRLVIERDGAGTILRRYVHGPGNDEPLVWYEGSGLTTKRWLHTDERGSVIAVTDSSGASIATNRYDEYGIPQSGNTGRFQYTGQTWVPELGLFYYKARFYSPTLGRFMQTDPIGYQDGVNWYAYVDDDPVNRADPTGLYACSGTKEFCDNVEGGVERVRRAASEGPRLGSRIPDRDQRLLKAASNALGRRDDGNGVTIQSGRTLGGGPGETTGKTITLNPGQLEQGIKFAGDRWDRYGEALSHEATHLWSHSDNADGYLRRLEDERPAYRTQYWMIRFLKIENPFYNPLRPVGSFNESQYVQQGSIESCATGGASRYECAKRSNDLKWW